MWVCFFYLPSIDVGGRMRNMMNEEKEGSFSNQDLYGDIPGDNVKSTGTIAWAAGLINSCQLHMAWGIRYGFLLDIT